MKNQLEYLGKILNTPLKRYIVIGGSVYIFEVAVILIAQALGSGPLIAVAISFWLGLLLSFGLQKVVTFSDKRKHYKILVSQFLAFSILVVFNFTFTIILSKLLIDIVPVVVSRTLALGICTIWNFYLYKTKIFNRGEGVIY